MLLRLFIVTLAIPILVFVKTFIFFFGFIVFFFFVVFFFFFFILVEIFILDLLKMLVNIRRQFQAEIANVFQTIRRTKQ